MWIGNGNNVLGGTPAGHDFRRRRLYRANTSAAAPTVTVTAASKRDSHVPGARHRQQFRLFNFSQFPGQIRFLDVRQKCFWPFVRRGQSLKLL